MKVDFIVTMKPIENIDDEDLKKAVATEIKVGIGEKFLQVNKSEVIFEG